MKGSFKREKIIFCKNYLKHESSVFNKFYFELHFFHIPFYQILKNGAILINRESFFQGKDSRQLDRFQFFKINSLMTETIRKQFFKTKFL